MAEERSDFKGLNPWYNLPHMPGDEEKDLHRFQVDVYLTPQEVASFQGELLRFLSEIGSRLHVDPRVNGKALKEVQIEGLGELLYLDVPIPISILEAYLKADPLLLSSHRGSAQRILGTLYLEKVVVGKILSIFERDFEEIKQAMRDLI